MRKVAYLSNDQDIQPPKPSLGINLYSEVRMVTGKRFPLIFFEQLLIFSVQVNGHRMCACVCVCVCE